MSPTVGVERYVPGIRDHLSFTAEDPISALLFLPALLALRKQHVLQPMELTEVGQE